MLSIQRLNARGANKNGESVVDYLFATEYYFDKDGMAHNTMRWGGLGVDALGLKGKAVDKADLLQLTKGFSPEGVALCQNAGREPTARVKLDRKGKPKLDQQGNQITVLEGGHRVGFDLTCSAPKPVSLAFAIADDEEKERILSAHRNACQVAMSYLESKVETRRGKGGLDVIGVGGLVYGQFDHFGNRNGEMNLHTHNLVFGVAQGADGKWGTFDAVELYRHRMAADQIYKCELGMNMQALGYGIEQYRETDANDAETGRAFWKINGISDELCAAFSTRRQEILDHMKAHGGSAQAACLATRKHKDEPSYAELIKIWSDTLAGMPEGSVPTIEQLKSQSNVLMDARTDGEILERLHAHEAMVSDHHLVERLAQEHAGQIRVPELLKKVEEFKSRAGMVHINPEQLADEDKGNSLARRHTESRYAAPWMVQFEQEIAHRVTSRQGEKGIGLSAETVEHAFNEFHERKGYELSMEQRDVVHHVTSDNGVSVISGLAGTGKTSVSDCYALAFQAEGRTMHGVAVSNAAALKLQDESGMKCRSVAAMLAALDNERITLTKSDVLVIDEAGMIGTKQTRALLAYAQQGGAKVIFQGDTSQLQPVEAGSGMALVKSEIGDKSLTEIRRQKHEADRAIAKLFYPTDDDGNSSAGTLRSRREVSQHGAEILKALDARNCIDEFDTRDQALQGLVSDYLGSEATVSDRLVLAHTHEDVRALNAAIRIGMKAQGHLDAEEVIVTTRDNGVWNQIPLSIGDRVRFTTNDRKMEVINGTAGVIQSCAKAEKGWNVTVEVQSPIASQNGRLISFNTERFKDLAPNWAGTVHKAQGQGAAEVFHLANARMVDNQSSLVAFTRLTKGSYTLYGSSEDVEQLKDRLGMERLKINATQAGVRESATELLTPVALSPAEQAWVDRFGQSIAERVNERREGWSVQERTELRRER